MPVDPSISLAAGTGAAAPQNPLNTLGQSANAINALNQTRLFPGQLQQQQLATNAAELNQTRQRMQAVGAMLAPLAGQPNLTHADVMGALGGLKAAGIPTQEFEADAHQTMPTSDGPELAQWFKTHVAARIMSPDAIAGSVVGSPGTMSNGQQIQPGVVGGPLSANPGAFTPAGGATQVFPSRSELATQVGRAATADDAATLGVPIGTPLTETMLQRLQQQGAGGLTGPAGVIGKGGPVSPQNPPRLPATPSTAPSTPTAATGRPVVTGLPPTAPAEMDASTQQYNSASAAANTFRQRVFPLQQAATALQSADTGPGSETVNQIKSFLLAQSPDSLKKNLPNVDPNKIASYDEAVKYLAQYASQQPGAAQSDMHLGLAQVANASTHISNQAARDVVQNALGLERMQHAATLSFNQQHPEPGAGALYNRWMQNFASQNDPRGFAWDDYDPTKQRSLLQNMSRNDKTRLLTSVTLARQLNLGANGQ